jgi:hypothetical protein
MRARAVACALTSSVVALGAATAQGSGEVRLDGGVARIAQNGREAKGAGLLSALWRGTTERFATLASGAFTYAGDSVTAVQGILAGAFRRSPESLFRIEGGATGAAFGSYALGRGGNLSAYLRQHLDLADGGFWAGGSVGDTERDDISSHATTFDLGALLRFTNVETSIAWSHIRTDDQKLMDAARVFLTRDAAAYDLDDFVLSAQFDNGRMQVGVQQSWRAGSRATVANQTAFAWSAAWAFTPRFSLGLGAGRQLADPVRGVPDAQVTSAVLRAVVYPSRLPAFSASAVKAYASVSPGTEGTLLVVRVSAGESQRVEVAGSFSGWEPVPLTRTPGGWEARATLHSGRYRVAVRVDGGPWRAPLNLGKVRDEFGGEAGLVVVP